jgi:Fe-S-cluster containining protein
VRDGPVRALVKTVARWAKTLDLRFTRWVMARSSPARYRLTGSCNGCGKCCEAPSQAVSRFTWYLPTARRVFLWWQRVVNGFELFDRDPRFRVFIYKCTHFDPVTKQCDSYETRPLMCRDYPTLLTFEAVPRLFPECSYVMQDKNAAALRASLVAAGVTGEKLAAMEKELFLTSAEEQRKP